MTQLLPLLQAIITLLVPLIAVLFPGIGLFSWRGERHVLAWGARVAISSLSFFTLVSYVLVFFHLPPVLVFPLATITALIAIAIQRVSFFTLPTLWYSLAVITSLLVVYAMFTVPFLQYQGGLPTGDSQKALFWAQDILNSRSLPHYQSSIERLNRDPVDFYTPGLHTTIAAFMQIASSIPLPSDTPNIFPFMVVGLYAIMVSILVAGIGSSIAKDIFDTPGRVFPAFLVFFFILTNERFLRYLKEPGYHLQNVIGELFLFALLLLAISLIHRFRIKDIVLFVASLLALLITHQFSAFIGVFLLVPAAVVFFAGRLHVFQKALKTYPALLGVVVLGLIVLVGGGIALGLHRKIPHLFTFEPHLLDTVPALSAYPTLMGGWWFFMSIAGVLLLAIHSSRRHQNYREAIVVLASCVSIFLLSQGPRIGIDIPAVRALFYAVLPYSIAAAFAGSVILGLMTHWKAAARRSASLLLVGLLMYLGYTQLQNAFSQRSLSTPTNSTLTAEQLGLFPSLANDKTGVVVIDDANRRSGSWLLLSQKPMVTRLASDIKRQMQESTQSQVRSEMYIRQLAFEKIYELPSKPYVTQVMDEYTVDLIAGILHSTATGFLHNPSLQLVASADDMLLFEKKPYQGKALPIVMADGINIIPWLLRPSTLVNDIGDDQDTQKHLPASLSATRLSAPLFTSNTTSRVTNAPVIPLVFNVGDYVEKLWNLESQSHPATALELFVELTHPTSGLRLQSTGEDIGSRNAVSLVRLEAKDVTIDNEGFITLLLENTTGQSISFDTIALGLARVP